MSTGGDVLPVGVGGGPGNVSPIHPARLDSFSAECFRTRQTIKLLAGSPSRSQAATVRVRWVDGAAKIQRRPADLCQSHQLRHEASDDQLGKPSELETVGRGQSYW
uniref:(northern house mosquito) hypothetical protein n=1 Tax=Culex pipiens TaxID=7175 RepID=A0A8D8EVM2_CULPI